MADSVFRVEVGAKIGASTTTLKKGIQGILDKMPARTVAIKLDVTKSRQNIKAGLDKLAQSTSIPVTLTVNGNGLRGASGKNFRTALKTITNDINTQQAAKITLHIDTKASQRAMLAELKKLDLGVNITPRNNNNNNNNNQPTTYAGALRDVTQLKSAANSRFAQSASLESASQRFQVLQAQGQRLMREAQQIRDAYLQTADAQKQGISQQSFDAAVAGNTRVTNSVDKVAAAYAKAADAQKKYSQVLADEALKQGAGLNGATEAGQKYQLQLDALTKQAQNGGWSMEYFRARLAKWKKEAKDAGAMAETAGEKFSRMVGDKIGYGAIALAMTKIRQALGEVYTNVVNIDAAMTELKKVTDETADTYAKFMVNAGAQARELGATMSDVVNATAGFARLGYNLADSSELAKTAIVYNNVGDEIASIDDATESVISTMQAFNIEAQNSMSIADKFNQIGRQNCPAA